MSERPADSARSVPSSVTSARDSSTTSVGSRIPKSDSTTTSSCMTSASITPPGRTCSASSRASARSRSSADVASSTSATRSTPSRSRLTSRRARAMKMSVSAACWIGSSRPTAPKSISPSVPSASTNTLPGWGSAWKKPSRITWSSIERSSWSASSGPVERRRREPRPRPSRRRGAPARGPAACTGGGARAGMRTRSAPSRRAAISAIASASRRKSSSARSPWANWATMSPVRTPRPNGVRRCASSPRRASAARSRSIVASMPGRWTLTTTCSPLCSRARCVWPIEAAASGSQSNSANTASMSPSSATSTAATASRGLRRHPVLQRRQLGAHLGRQEVDAGGGDLAELDVHAARLLEHAPQAAPPGSPGRVRAPDRGPKPSRRARRDELPVAAEDGHSPAHGADGAGRHDEPGALADRQRAGTGEQVEADGGGHRGRDADRHEVEQQPVGAPVPAVDTERDDDRDAPPERAGEQRRAPPPARAEQAQREARDGDGHGDGQDDADEHAERAVEDGDHDAPPGARRRLDAAEHEVAASLDLVRRARHAAGSRGRCRGRRSRCRRPRRRDRTRSAHRHRSTT